ncbi:MAG: DUF934 domain-containing protein [Pseudomonadota bacterium]|nr:DUF934 domain-containing protein [Pseudomonadota bacterium]
MAKLIKQGALQDTDPWSTDTDGYRLVTLEQWQNERDAVLAELSAGRTGLLLDSHETADLIGDDSRHFPLIAVNFPKFADGRGYSAARLLRERHGYQGELRAVGDVLIDQLFYMKRCGFDAFALREDQDSSDALQALSTFSVTYQADVGEPRPLFRRR